MVLFEKTIPSKYVEYILEKLLVSDNTRKVLLKAVEYSSKNKCIITMSAEQADEIRDSAGEYLQICGFDSNYSLTSDGVILEKIVDFFYVEQ